MPGSFDIIIVGAGTAGCVLADKLSRNPSTRVLLLEAGGWDRDPLVSIPMGVGKLAAKSDYDWGDVSEPDAGLEGRRLPIQQGRLIGGGSSVNFMAHLRGHPADFDGWAEMGASGWGFDEVLPFFRECETWEGGGGKWRGGEGQIGVRISSMRDPIYAAWFAMLQAQGYRLTPDYNGADCEGFGPLQYAIRNGRRSSAASAFLHPALKRPNLTVITRARATRLLIEGRRQTGVEYLHRGERRTAISRQRTVLCLGAIGTPQLLMLSGIGPAQHLRSMDIEPIVDLPVGQGLEDHLGIHLLWMRRHPGELHRSLRMDRAIFNMARAHLLGSGPSAELPAALVGWLRSRDDQVKPDLQFFLQLPPPDTDAWFPGIKKPFADGYGIRVQLVGQCSRGEVRLRSTDPLDRPVVRHNSLNAPEDIAALRFGFRKAWAMGEASQLKDFRAMPAFPSQSLDADDEIDAFIRSSALQLYHPACTCAMGGEEAVLDPSLAVRGIEGLNVVDASVMPSLVSANPNFAVMMIAAKAAAMWNG